MITRAEIGDRADRFGVPTEQIERDHLISQVLVAATADETRAWQPYRSSLLSCSDGSIPATCSPFMARFHPPASGSAFVRGFAIGGCGGGRHSEEVDGRATMA